MFTDMLPLITKIDQGYVSGTTAAAGVSTPIIIDTGLSSISKFIWYAKATNVARMHIIEYDSTLAIDKFSSASIGGSAGAYESAIGIAAQTYQPVITSITGGVIVITTGTNSSYAKADAGTWIAFGTPNTVKKEIRKNGTSSATLTANSQIVIDTGLTEITRFVWFAKSKGANIQAVITYDSSVDANKFNVATIGASYGYYQRAIGAATGSDFVSLTSIVNGTVTLTTASGYNIGVLDQGYWYAE